MYACLDVELRAVAQNNESVSNFCWCLKTAYKKCIVPVKLWMETFVMKI